MEHGKNVERGRNGRNAEGDETGKNGESGRNGGILALMKLALMKLA